MILEVITRPNVIVHITMESVEEFSGVIGVSFVISSSSGCIKCLCRRDHLLMETSLMMRHRERVYVCTFIYQNMAILLEAILRDNLIGSEMHTADTLLWFILASDSAPAISSGTECSVMAPFSPVKEAVRATIRA